MKNSFKEMPHLFYFKELREIVKILDDIDLPAKKIPPLRKALESMWEWLGEREDAYMELHE